ncbi:LysR family transcriptional regulator [Thauera linaloolentis]|uniref:LysR family transcriptional regulator n=1 Tax=Thauera linaloolentis (strain DSM 12138 / JCM 21573 / CCUG 41526 / CIP 105981 / IAM 15112 / NBRC 102519 / 47Lol) TaxID=1123367 RepID=N6XXM8_THAL4|nr:LysR family transcriptional regulator [Thauera linaloolentis]ENO86571.1 LysR family transcriptional regulator [Thauera linaloolentis 47Lol = DSM 12138]MCM8565757.1 LysR family transcriptional regulator [Thauera linaloolentis]
MSWLPAWEGFIRVVEGGSMAAAARTLGCTRAQISKQMAELERRLGARLFERSTRRLALTPAGEVFHQHALRALEAVDGTEIAMRNLGDRPCGTLRVSATVSFGRHCVAPLLPGVAAAHPDLEIELILTDHVVDLVGDSIDLALRMTRLPPDDAVARRIVSLRRVVCAAPAYLERHGTPHLPLDLLQHQCLSYLLGDNKSWVLVDGNGVEAVVPVRSRIHFNNIDCMLDAVLAGHGIAILPTYLCHRELAGGILHTVLDGYEPDVVFGRDLYACYTPSRVRVPKVRVFLDALLQRFQPVPPWEGN